VGGGGGRGVETGKWGETERVEKSFWFCRVWGGGEEGRQNILESDIDLGSREHEDTNSTYVPRRGRSQGRGNIRGLIKEGNNRGNFQRGPGKPQEGRGKK